MFSGPGAFSELANSGAATAVTARFRILGAAVVGAILDFGRATVAVHSTMFGNCGTIFGASGGASGRINVCRGWVTRTGFERIACRGWKAFAPRRANGFAGLPGGLGFEAGPGNLIVGKSCDAGYQVNSIRTGARLCCVCGRNPQMGSSAIKIAATCHNDDATMARPGGFPPTHSTRSAEFSAASASLGARGPVKYARTLARNSRHGDSHSTPNFGSGGAGRTSSAIAVAAAVPDPRRERGCIGGIIIPVTVMRRG